VIAIVGATGALGGDVARRLLAAGTPVVAITRNAAKATPLRELGAEVRVADLTAPRSLAEAVRGAEAVFAAAHSLLGRGKYISARVDDAGHRALVDAARAERVGHFVYTSVLGASPAHPVAFWRTKFGIEEHLKASGLSYTILRPAAFMETHAHELLGKAIMAGKPAVIFGRGDRPVNFVAVRDVATFAVLALTSASARGQTIEIGGPGNPTRNEVAALYARLSGRPLATRRLGTGALKFLAVALRPFHPGISDVLRMGAEFETIDQSFDAAETLARYPTSLTPIETFVRERVEAARSH
jgi:uncharacterized protein YbjT (DUF2867 family)